MDDKILTVKDMMRDARNRLAAEFGEREASAMVDEMMWRLKGWDRTATIIHGEETVTGYLTARVDHTVKKLLEGNPIQYIFGRAQFYGRDFIVTPDTLIPRPETAQLVDFIADRYGKTSDLRVLDLGTGSGCIALSLACTLPFPKEITAVDISEKALEVARQNATDLKVKATFICGDMLAVDFAGRYLYSKYDIIVSNPPYIAQHEAAAMERNVLDHEPHTALFVPDDDPLLFYRAIARIASECLEDKGTLFLEINPLFAKELAAMLREHGFQDVDIEKDMQKADRFIIAKR
ncbi:MAG: peptide chain release factor N(5)-glutamine methyltransferase [Muribaculaceae bacterium]|nr:peptide chain release factor N(5)-glutamine methyltransferase [Muribaculaceae bacterium]